MRERKVSKSSNSHQNGGHLSWSKFAKLLDPDASWDKVFIFYCVFYVRIHLRDQLGDALHWIRQLLALVCGLTWGALPLVGGIWFILFVVLSTGIIYAYYALVLKVDEEDFGGHGALLQEGLFASISLFLLAWILVYSLAHF